MFNELMIDWCDDDIHMVDWCYCYYVMMLRCYDDTKINS